MNRKEFKNLLSVWNQNSTNKSSSQSLILEAKISDVKNELINSNKISVEDWDFYVNNPDVSIRNKLRKDSIFLDIVYNTLKEGKHSIYDIVSLFEDYLVNISSQFGRGESLYVKVPGGERIDLRSKLENKTASYDDIFAYLEAKKKIKLNTNAFIKCLKSSNFSENSGDSEHFDVIVNESSSDWIICYPKTIKGSISLARSYWNGNKLSYDTTFNKKKSGQGDNVGVISWCTSIDSESNMFLNYHRRLNLHMYYCISKYKDINDKNRKLCVSFAKKNKNIMIKEGSASVNAHNNPINKQEIKDLLGDLYDLLFKDVDSNKRLEIDPEEYYKSISFEQYKTLKEANLENINLFIPELENIITYSEDNIKIVKDLAYESNEKLKNIGIESKFLSKEVISDLLENETDQKIIDKLISNRNCPFDKILSLPEDKKNSIAYYKALTSNKNCPLDILNKVIKNEYDYKVYFKYDFDLEEIQYKACLNAITKFKKLDNKAQLNFENIMRDNIDIDSTGVIEDFYNIVDKDERKKDQSIYNLFFSFFDFEDLNYIARSHIINDKLLPDDICNKFFEAILPPLSMDPYGYAIDNLEVDYAEIINHDRLPLKLFKNIYDLASKNQVSPKGCYLELAKNKRTPGDLLKLLISNEDIEVSKEAKENLASRNSLISTARKKDITDDELIAMSAGKSQKQKVEIVRRKDLNSFDIETTRIVLRNIIEAGKINRKFMKFLSEREDLIELGLELNDLQTIHNNLKSDFDKNEFVKNYPQVLENQKLTSESILKTYIKMLLS